MVPPSSSVRSAELTRDAVVEVALTMADAGGLDTLTIRRLATHFGVTPMALYWHVKNKDELLDAMGDAVFAAVSCSRRTIGPGWTSTATCWWLC
jgi:TetR/AcrR family tetracycline transcriptional repressor